MGRITTTTGLISGINTGDIIDQLIKLEEQPKTDLQTRKDKVAQQKTLYNDFLTKLTDLQSIGKAFARPATFTASRATSSNEDSLTASASASAAVGSYQFQVAQLVTSQRSVSAGFTDTTANVGAGTLTVELGGGSLATKTELATLNGGTGVSRGQFRITDGSGNSAVIDTGNAITVDDIAKKINTSLDVSVRATVKDDRLVLTDASGGTTNTLAVADLAGGRAAADLGIAGAAVVGETTLTGTDINSIGSRTNLSTLNDGRGVRINSDAIADFRIALGDGTNVDVSLAGSRTVADVIAKINAAGGSKLTASVAAGANGVTLTDSTGGPPSVTALNGSNAAADLGILKTGSGSTLTGAPLLAGIDSVLVSSLNGGTGLPLGRISVRDRSGGSATIDLSGATSVQDIIDTINTASGVHVTASLKPSGNGIQIADASGGTGNLVIGDVNSTTAAALGIGGTFDSTKPAATGSNLQLQWINENTQLSSYNGGKGVTPGAFTVTNSAGTSTTIDLSSPAIVTLGDAIKAINTANGGVTASVNANGDGLLLTDTAGGAGKLKVQNLSGSTATDLNIAGTAAGTTIDGSFEKTVDIAATDTLSDVQTKIRALSFGVSASIISDGSAQAPYRLSLTSYNAGVAGQVTFDAGTTSLGTTNLVQAQDAAVFLGNSSSSQPLLVTSSKNQLSNIVPGVTVDLTGVSDGPVTLNVTRDADSIVDQVSKFVDGFNAVVTQIGTATKFDTDTNTAGLLLGEQTIQDVQNKIYDGVTAVVKGAGKYTSLADVGVTVGDGAQLKFDEAKFRSAFADDPEGVKNLFAQVDGGLTGETQLSSLNNGKGVRLAPAGAADFRVATRDGSHFDVNLSSAGSVSDVLAAINTASSGKVTATVAANGLGLLLTDNSTTGAGVISVGALNGSLAATDLGIGGSGVSDALTGQTIYPASSSTSGGVGTLIVRSLTSLVDPVSGILSQENKTLDDQSQQFQDRMDSIDALVTSKRARLEQQFANMETVLAKLQSQQTAIASIKSAAA